MMTYPRIISSFILLFFTTTNLVYPENQRIYIACDDHTDYLWSGDEKTYEQSIVKMLDYYINLADETQNQPPEYQSRFVCDGSYWLKIYQQNRSPEEFNHLIDRIKSGHITIPLNPLCCLYGSAPAEAVIRSMYYAAEMHRKYNIDFPLSIQMENQTLPWGVASLLAGSGAKYCWKGICGCASKVPDAGDRQHDIYYYTGPDNQKILMKWNSMLGDNKGMGGYAEARDPTDTIHFVETSPAFKARYPYSIIGCFGKGWDDLETLTDEFPRIAREITTPEHQIIVSNMIDFFPGF